MEIKNGIVTKIHLTDCAYDEVIVQDRAMVIGSSAGMNLNMKKVFLPNCVTEIDSYAFLNCENLEEINLPTGLKKIGERSFANCKSLKRIVVPEGVTEIGAGAFAGCDNLEEIVLPSTIKKIKFRTFADCKNLKKVLIPNSVESMEWGIFSGCHNLISIDIPDSVKKFEYQMFLNCNNLKHVSLPASLTYLPDETFMGCSNLDYKLPLTIKKVGDNAFNGCKKMRAFPNHVIKFGKASFKNCRNITTASINEKVEVIPDSMFEGCIKLTTVNGKKTPIGKRAFRSCINLTQIPSIVKTYNDFAFENCIGLKEITITNDKVSEGTFRGCKNISKINNSKIITSLGQGAFAGCENLETFECSPILANIPDSTFERCKSLISITMADGILRIGNRALYGCEKLLELNLPSCLEKLGDEALKKCNSIKYIYIPDNLKEIGNQALAYMSSLKHIKVSSANKTFCSCDNLTLIHKQHRSIVQYAIGFKNKHYSIEPFSIQIDILNREIIRQIASIDTHAFAGAINLEELTVMSGTDYIEKDAFEDCPNLKKLNVKRLPLFSIMGFRVTENKHQNYDIGNFPFEDIYLDDTIISVEISAFSGFPKLKNIHLGNKELGLIRTQSFTRCNNLKEVFIPPCVNQIEEDTFAPSTLLKFANGIKVKGSNFNNLQTRRGSKIYALNNGTYYVEKNNTLVSISKRKIKELCVNSNYIINSPEIIIDFTNLMKKYNKKNKSLMNGLLISSLSFEEAEDFIRDYDDFSATIIKNSQVLSNSDSPISKTIIKNPRNLINYIALMKKYEVKDINVMNGVFIAALTADEAETFIKHYDANIKRLIKASRILLKPDSAVDNMKDLFKLAKILGVFEDDSIIKQRACCFITEKMFEEYTYGPSELIDTSMQEVMPGIGNTAKSIKTYQIVGDDIHRHFNNIKPRDIFDYEFANFFITNYKKIYEHELKRFGFMERVYNKFEEIAKTCTSDKGEQRRLMVTLEKCHNYLLTSKFTGVTPETEHIAKLLGKWFDSNKIFEIGVTFFEEAQSAPRNIFTNFIIDKNKQLVFDNNPTNDLIEPVNQNYSYEWINKQSEFNLIIGKYCNCCAHVSGAGAGIARASMIDPNCQNLIIRSGTGEIIAKSTIYVNREEGYAVFNNLEASNLHRDDESKQKIYNAFIRGTKVFLSKYNDNNPNAPLELITIGMNRNIIAELLIQKDDIHPQNNVLETINYGIYAYENEGYYIGDSNTSQRIVLRKKIYK